MLSKVASGIAVSTFAVLALGAQAAQAGGGCRGSSCYNLVESPPVYGSVSETYLARPAQTRSRIIPAEYDYVTENVLVHPERRIPHHRPAHYKTVAEKVLVSHATRRWEVTRDAHGRTTGCWVDVPARYAMQHRSVQVSPASVDYETIPAVYSQRQRKVMVRATQVVHDTIPAVYETRQRHVVIKPASQHWARGGY